MGNGAREDALSWRLAASPSCEAIFAAPGNAGTATRGQNWDIRATDGKALTERALSERIDLAVLGPETAIAAGVGDRLRAAGIATFGPDRSSGRLESSKIFSKRFMERHQIPTAKAAIVHSLSAARKTLGDWRGSCVIKADGLAAGKGVVVAQTAEQARETVEQWYSGNQVPGGGTGVLLEEKLEGRELSVFAIGDGRAFFPFGSACDYKRAEDGDRGPNTGGMGAYSPPSGFPENFEEEVREKIIAPALRGLLAEGERYIGVLYCGLMWTQDGPHVIEFNARFGDPETQVLMPRVTGDFAALLKSAADGALDATAATLSERACVGIVIASRDYPRTSTPLSGLPSQLDLPESAHAFWSSSNLRDGAVDVTGGRVLTVTACDDGLDSARERAYETVRAVMQQFGRPDELRYRSDIAKR
ncbi:MAG TPA: phosphoribosylamine--glycine ligase [Candidatus Rubrimentiphilum sp.]|nr:phosphoribosylamine--glycine ligase [Candidatus Rubrimentiphilum sp.]